MKKTKLSYPELILFAAFRYALGSMTYIVGVVVEEILDNWDALTPGRKKQIKEEIIEYKKDNGDLGMACDEAQWRRILKKS